MISAFSIGAFVAGFQTSPILCVSFLSLFQILPNPDFAHLDSDKITEHFHTLLFGIVHQVGV